MKKVQKSIVAIEILISLIYWGARFTAFPSTIQKYAFSALLLVFIVDKVLSAHNGKSHD